MENLELELEFQSILYNKFDLFSRELFQLLAQLARDHCRANQSLTLMDTPTRRF